MHPSSIGICKWAFVLPGAIQTRNGRKRFVSLLESHFSLSKLIRHKSNCCACKCSRWFQAEKDEGQRCLAPWWLYCRLVFEIVNSTSKGAAYADHTDSSRLPCAVDLWASVRYINARPLHTWRRVLSVLLALLFLTKLCNDSRHCM